MTRHPQSRPARRAIILSQTILGECPLPLSRSADSGQNHMMRSADKYSRNSSMRVIHVSYKYAWGGSWLIMPATGRLSPAIPRRDRARTGEYPTSSPHKDLLRAGPDSICLKSDYQLFCSVEIQRNEIPYTIHPGRNCSVQDQATNKTEIGSGSHTIGLVSILRFCDDIGQ